MHAPVPPKLAQIIREATTAVQGDAGPALLLRFVADRDGEAFRGLVQLHAPLVWGVCQRALRNTHDAEDAFQATFIVLSRKARCVSPPERLPAWLFGVAIRCTRKVRAAAARRREIQLPTVPDRPADALRSGSDFGWVLDEELDNLAPDLRQAVVLCHVEGRSHAQAARMLGCSKSTLGCRLRTATGLLRNRLGRRGLAPNAALAGLLVAESQVGAVPPHVIDRAADGLGPRVDGTAATVAEEVARGMGERLARRLAGWAILVAISGFGVAAVTGAQPVSPPPFTAVVSATPVPAGRVDRFGDPLPAGATARIGTVRFRPGGHSAGGASVAFDLGGSAITCHGGDSIHFWDAAGHEVRRLNSFRRCHAVAISPDGRWLACGGWKTVRVHDLARGGDPIVWQVDASDTYCRWLAFSPNSESLICFGGSGDSDLRCLDAATGANLWSLSGRTSCVAVSPDGKTFATGTASRELAIRELASGRVVRTLGLLPPRQTVLRLVFSPDGKTLAASCLDGSVQLWDPAGERERQICEGGARDIPHAQILAVDFTPDGKTLVAAGSGRIRFFDPTSGRECRPEIDGPWDASAARISPDATRLAVATSATVRVWDLTTGCPIGPPAAPDADIVSVAFSPDGRTLVTNSSAGYPARVDVRIWDATDGSPVRRLAFDTAKVSGIPAVAFAADGSVAATCQPVNPLDGRSWLARWDPGHPAARVASLLPVGARGIALSRDGERVAVSTAEEVVLQEVTTGSKVADLDDGVGTDQLTFSDDGGTLAGHNDAGGPIAWSRAPNGTWARNGRPLDVERFESFLKLSADGRRLACGDGERVRIFDLASGVEVFRIPERVRAGRCLEFSPDGRTVACGGDDGTVRVRDVEGGRVRRVLSGHRGRIRSVAFSPDGRRLVSGGTDCTALIWDLSAEPTRRSVPTPLPTDAFSLNRPPSPVEP